MQAHALQDYHKTNESRTEWRLRQRNCKALHMPDLARGFVFLGLAIAGWMASKHCGRFARITIRVAPLIAAVFTCCLALTGFFRTVGSNAETHRWTGHALVIFLWLYVPFAIGILLYVHGRTSIAAVQSIVFLAILSLGLLCAITGYLPQTGLEPLSEETYLRFEILHKYALPSIFFALLVESWWFFRPRRPSAQPNT